MKIAHVDVYKIELPLEKPKRYPNKTYESLDSTIVRLETGNGIIGWGEVCPIASTYQPEHALGVRAAIEEMAPGLIGQDPTQTDVINATMNKWLMGAEYAKSAIDIACWDITGKAYNVPVYHLLGGRQTERAKAYCEIEYGPADAVPGRIDHYRQEGYTQFQVKVGRGGNFEQDIARIRKAGESVRPGEVLVCDGNKAWKTHEAIRILSATRDVDYYVEQPCLTYEECLSVRRQMPRPMILDECMTDIKLMLRALADDAFEGIGCKITRVGGITGMRTIRDVCTAAGKILTCDDAWGSDLSVAAQTHVAMSTPEKTLFATYISSYFTPLTYDEEAARFDKGYIQANPKPGLGVEPRPGMFGDPVMSFS